MHPISFSKGLTAAACLLCLSLFTFVEDRKSEGDSLFPVVINNRYGYINRSGKVVIPARFLDAREFQGERAWIRVGTKSRKEYGFIDTTGNLAFTKFFPDAYPFSEGIAAVAVGGPRGQRLWMTACVGDLSTKLG